jgi:hypothetical protein
MNTPTQDPNSPIIDLNASRLCGNLLEHTLREGARQMLQKAIELEVRTGVIGDR